MWTCVAVLLLGQITINGTPPPNYLANASFPGTNANVELSPSDVMETGGPPAFHMELMRQSFPAFHFDYGGNLSGTFLVNTYQATATDTKGGADLLGTYIPAVNDPPLANLRFIQIVTTSDPLQGTSPYVDANPLDGTPFYYTSDQDKLYKKPDSGWYIFGDRPSRFYPPVMFPVSGRTWQGDLYLCSFDGEQMIVVYDSVTWGFLIQQYPPCCAWTNQGAAAAFALLSVALMADNQGRNDAHHYPLKLSLEKKVYQSGERIKILLEIKNATPLPVTIWDASFWNNHQVRLRDERGREPKLTDYGRGAQLMFGGGRDRNIPIEIAPGKTWKYGYYDIVKAYELKPGKYQLQVIYEEDEEPTPLRVISNRVSFTVE
jgi:hypothetical protein